MKRMQRSIALALGYTLILSLPVLAARGGNKSRIPVEEVVKITAISFDDNSDPDSVLALITVANVTGDFGQERDASGTIQGDAYWCGGTIAPDGSSFVPCGDVATPEPNTVARITYYLQSEGLTIPAAGSAEFVIEFPRSDLNASGDYVFFFQGRLCVEGNSRCSRYLHAASAAFINP